MIKLLVPFLIGAILAALITKAYEDCQAEAVLNTAAVIRAAWEFRRLVESLEEDIDTRCHVALLADSKVEDLLASAEALEARPSRNLESDAFAVQSVVDAVDIYSRNEVIEIAENCRAEGDA